MHYVRSATHFAAASHSIRRAGDGIPEVDGFTELVRCQIDIALCGGPSAFWNNNSYGTGLIDCWSAADGAAERATDGRKFGRLAAVE
jgi:hypothetical protein